MNTELSVIIPTYNGANKIEETLEALCNQTIHDFETIVVVDGSTDNTINVVRNFTNRLSNLVIEEQINGGRACARNKGATLAKGEILLFIDDDIEVLPDNIEQHITFHQMHKQATLVGNPMLNIEKTDDDIFLNYRADSEKRWDQKHRDGITRISFQNYIFTTQNMSLRKTLFFHMGEFDERLTDSEDFDFSLRLILADKPIFFNRDIKCYHNDFAGLALTIKRQSQYYLSKKALLKLHPEYKTLVPFQFEWQRKTYKDIFRKMLFKNRSLWEYFFGTHLFSLLPSFIRNLAFSSLIYTHSVLTVKKSD